MNIGDEGIAQNKLRWLGLVYQTSRSKMFVKFEKRNPPSHRIAYLSVTVTHFWSAIFLMSRCVVFLFFFIFRQLNNATRTIRSLFVHFQPWFCFILFSLLVSICLHLPFRWIKEMKIVLNHNSFYELGISMFW